MLVCGGGGQALLHEEGLARELAADFYARRKRHLLVYDYLKEGTACWESAGEVDVINVNSERHQNLENTTIAHNTYARWGSAFKMKQLEDRFSLFID